MSLSDWLHKPATRRSVGIPLALVAAGAVLLWLWPDAPPFPQRQTIESYEAFSETIDPECSAVLANPQQSSAVPRQVDECAEKAAIQKKGYRDLAQSVRASNATEEAAWLSYLQTRAAIVGAAFVVLTLAATAWAAWAAADAARIADKSAAAAIKAADAEDSYNTGLRQFLDEKSYKPTFEPFRLAPNSAPERSSPSKK